MSAYSDILASDKGYFGNKGPFFSIVLVFIQNSTSLVLATWWQVGARGRNVILWTQSKRRLYPPKYYTTCELFAEFLEKSVSDFQNPSPIWAYFYLSCPFCLFFIFGLLRKWVTTVLSRKNLENYAAYAYLRNVPVMFPFSGLCARYVSKRPLCFQKFLQNFPNITGNLV